MRLFHDVFLDILSQKDGYIMMFPKGMLRFAIIDNLQSRIIYFDAIWICPHLIKLVLILFSGNFSISVVL